MPTSPACVTAAVRASVGEVRGGEVLSLLKAWNISHPGGVCSVHANDARGGLRRIEQLIAEVSQNPDAGTHRRRGEVEGFFDSVGQEARRGRNAIRLTSSPPGRV